MAEYYFWDNLAPEVKIAARRQFRATKQIIDKVGTYFLNLSQAQTYHDNPAFQMRDAVEPSENEIQIYNNVRSAYLTGPQIRTANARVATPLASRNRTAREAIMARSVGQLPLPAQLLALRFSGVPLRRGESIGSKRKRSGSRSRSAGGSRKRKSKNKKKT
jgi:hypothetical protein